MHHFQKISSKNGYKCFRRDCNKYGGGLMFSMSEGIPCNV